jgi:hypothetical protein
MRFDGGWEVCKDGTVRPLLLAEIHAASGEWHGFEMLVDTGADRTVLSANVWKSLDPETSQPETKLAGIGGHVDAVRLRVKLALTRDDGQMVIFRTEVAACVDDELLDMSVLGRDIIDMFTLIADREGDVLALLGGNHSYSIQSS